MPTGPREVLVWPEIGRIIEDVELNRSLLNDSSAEIGGYRLGELRRSVRRELLGRAGEYTRGLGFEAGEIPEAGPLIVTGHQCQFNHAGIFIKYALLDYLAGRTGGVALNIVVDSDLPKNIDFRVPVEKADGAAVRLWRMGGVDGSVPMEFQAVPGEEFWAAVEKEAGGLRPIVDSGKVREVLGEARECSARAGNLAEMFTLLNHRLAGRLGLRWLELPVSRLCDSEGFGVFAADMAGRAAEAVRCYNGALAEYRGRNGISGRSRPMPDLRVAGDRFELPFWKVGRGKRREGVFADDMDGSLRPRAVGLTAFLRLFLADYFIHGIGGARYDEVTDSFVSEFYGVRAPRFGCVSATLYPAGGEGLDAARLAEQLRQLERMRRDVVYNPQRYLGTGNSGGAAELTARREAAVRKNEQLKAGGSAEERRAVFEEIREVNRQLKEIVANAGREIDEKIERLKCRTKLEEIWRDREYYFGLFGNDVLRTLVDKIV